MIPSAAENLTSRYTKAVPPVLHMQLPEPYLLVLQPQEQHLLHEREADIFGVVSIIIIQVSLCSCIFLTVGLLL